MVYQTPTHSSKKFLVEQRFKGKRRIHFIIKFINLVECSVNLEELVKIQIVVMLLILFVYVFMSMLESRSIAA